MLKKGLQRVRAVGVNPSRKPLWVKELQHTELGRVYGKQKIALVRPDKVGMPPSPHFFVKN
jgi:hypothetical protein